RNCGTSLRLHFGNHTYATLLRLPNYPSAIAVLGPLPRTSHHKSRITLTARPKKECAPVLLVGASFGGFSIRIFAFQYSERAAGLVLVDAAHEDQGARTPPPVRRKKASGMRGLCLRLHVSAGCEWLVTHS